MANNKTSAILAESIIRSASKQAYYTGRLLVDKDLISDFFRAYAYLRWVDDVVDSKSISDNDRISFSKRQRYLIDSLFKSEKPAGLSPEEEMVSDLVQNERGKNSGLKSFICNMFSIIEFDAYRKGRLISEKQLTWYSETLGTSITDGMQYFIKNGHPYPGGRDRILAPMAAHITHLLRDMLSDLDNGFINIPREYLEKNNINAKDINHPLFRQWIRNRVWLARQYFKDGINYLKRLKVLRCKLAGLWYCARFESILKKIEMDDYILKSNYKVRRNITIWLKIILMSFPVLFSHLLVRKR